MKKLKMFAIAGGLLLVTAGVFAGKSKFLTEVYAINASSVFVPLTSTIPSTSILTTTQSGSSTAITCTDHLGVKYGLYEFNGSSYLPFYAATTF